MASFGRRERGLGKLALEFHFKEVLIRTKSEDLNGFFPAILLCKPTGRLREEHHSTEQEDGREHLKTPWDSECSSSMDIGASVRNVEHDKDTPGDGP